MTDDRAEAPCGGLCPVIGFPPQKADDSGCREFFLRNACFDYLPGRHVEKDTRERQKNELGRLESSGFCWLEFENNFGNDHEAFFRATTLDLSQQT